ncbi:MAG: thioesterase family protein [Candidatus Eisenbacteria bacterium]|nr:thioesterase family protein [Candidatus Eisenbacteria bacterium]
MSFSVTVRVRYAESDQMGVAYYSNYFIWFEVARTELMRKHGVPYSEWERTGLFLPVSECYCKYMTPAHYDETLDIRCWIAEVRTRAVRFEYEIVRDASVLARGHTVHVCTDKNAKPSTMPASLRDALLEAGKDC